MDTFNEYDVLKKQGAAGFASVYLEVCVKSKSDDKIDIEVYTKLVQLDAKLAAGCKLDAKLAASKQLFWLLQISLRLDLLKVLFGFKHLAFGIMNLAFGLIIFRGFCSLPHEVNIHKARYKGTSRELSLPACFD